MLDIFKSKLSCRKLEENDAEEAALLYAYSCRFDTYFKEVFGKDTVEQEIYDNYREDVYNAVKFGDSYGMFCKDKMVGIVLAFNITDWRNNHPDEINRVFSGSTNLLKLLTDFIKEQDTDLLYIFAVCVLDDYRCQGVAKRMIKTICSKYDKMYTIISDAMHSLAMPMWLSNGFCEMRRGEYSFVIRR